MKPRKGCRKTRTDAKALALPAYVWSHFRASTFWERPSSVNSFSSCTLCAEIVQSGSAAEFRNLKPIQASSGPVSELSL